MKKALKRMAAAALVTLSVLRGGDAFAQNAVDGRVVDANGAPLVGVTVLIKGTQSGTATGANGSYSIKAREDQTPKRRRRSAPSRSSTSATEPPRGATSPARWPRPTWER